MIDPKEVEAVKQCLRSKPPGEDGRIMAGCSFVQRRMQWGYNHAATIIEALEAEGWLGAPDFKGGAGSTSRNFTPRRAWSAMSKRHGFQCKPAPERSHNAL